MRRTLATLVLLLASAPTALADDYPHVVIENKKLKFKLYETDAKKGFYRGTRFDHAGVFGEVEFAGHKIFGPWKGTHDPANHDDIIGPCEEFGIDSPLGYDDAKVGGTFLKIGVGELEKPDEKKYSFWNKYKVVKPLQWARARTHPTITENAPENSPTQVWRAEQKANGYGYQYTKIIRLGDGASVILFHTLKNTGEKRIVTDVYNHNFFNVDGDPIGPNYSFAFANEVKAQDPKGKFGDLVTLDGQTLRFKDKVTDGDLMAGLTGFDPKNSKHRGFMLRHAASGVTVIAVHDYPFSKFNVWGMKTTICPEPYMAIDLKPGEEVKWSILYTFQHDPPKK